MLRHNLLTHARAHTHRHTKTLSPEACVFVQSRSQLAVLESIKNRRSAAENIEANTANASNVNTTDGDIGGWPKPKLETNQQPWPGRGGLRGGGNWKLLCASSCSTSFPEPSGRSQGPMLGPGSAS